VATEVIGRRWGGSQLRSSPVRNRLGYLTSLSSFDWIDGSTLLAD
jgi:hypothetical protein